IPLRAAAVVDAAPPVMPTLAGIATPRHQPPAMPHERYVLGGEIARGGMGRVVEATATVLGRVVAVKEALALDADTLKRFARETRITARLEHPSIVPVHDAGAMHGGAPFYVVLAHSPEALLVWSFPDPPSTAQLAGWLDGLTNAIIDPSGALRWQ
nr:hypothetical protein [Deltaproteobacteria bacterium]